MADTLPSNPTALEYVSPVGGLNGPLSLYSGDVEFSQESVTFTAKAVVCLEWLPSPQVRFEMPELPLGVSPDLVDSVTMRLEDGRFIQGAVIRRIQPSGGPADQKSKASGIIGGWAGLDSASVADHALFVVPNFRAPTGRGVSFPDGTSWACRHQLIGGGWSIRLDGRPDGRDVSEALDSQSGFAVTHVGRLSRTDGSAFTAREAVSVLVALNWYVSFTQGAWAGPCLPVGMTAEGGVSWRVWQVSRVAAHQFATSWLDRIHSAAFEGLFPEFMALWSDPDWEEVVRVAIHWYVEANNQAGSVEGAITLTQTALELLASALLVDKHKWVSSDGYEKLTAADRLRLLFAWAGIPTAIPAGLGDLEAAAKADNWPDAPTAMTAIRNTITHPTRKNREKLGRHAGQVKHEVWRLGLWFLELCLLRLFEHRGVYANRLIRRYQGQVECVPWATEP